MRTIIHNRLKLMKLLLIVLTCSFHAFAIDVVELQLPSSNKIVMKFMFKNGSIADPVGKEGLTFATAQLVAAPLH